MSEEISKIARVYQFLSDYGEQWKDAADQCGYADGVVTKAEFRAFMLGSDFEWANEDSDSAKRDLINQFWNTIDTKRSGRVAGSSKSNLDALDKDEVNKMQEKIEIYDAAIAFAATLELPEGATVNDYSAWVKKVKESILSRVEKFIKDGGKLENLQEFLEAQGQEAVVITTADMIAQDLIKEKVGNIPNYGGYNTDGSLKTIIDRYIASLKQNPDVSGAEISETITRLVNAYVSTLDGMPSESDIELLGQYGYKINEKSGLNDLQKAVLSNSLTEKLAKIKVGDDYDKYPELFDKAIEEFINSLLSDTKMADFAAVKNYGIPEFEASEAYKNLKTNLQITKFFSSDNFKNKLKEVLGETISEKVGGKWSGELPVLDEIIKVALERAAEGGFGNPIDENKLAEWAIKQIEENIKAFFPDGFKDLSLTQMGDAYQGFEKSAQDTQNIETLRYGATSYCDGLIGRNNTAFKNAVIDLFGENYAEKIKTLSSTEISKLMAELIAKIDELGDASTFKIDDKNAIWSDLPDTISILTNDTNKQYKLGRTLDIDGHHISSDRITYSAVGNDDILQIDKTTGEITIVGKTAGDYDISINVIVDGIKVGTRKIRVTVKYDSKLDFDSVGVTNGITAKEGTTGKNADYSNSILSAISGDTSYVLGFINDIYNALLNKGKGVDPDALAKAKTNMDDLYTKMINQLYNDCANNHAERGYNKQGCYQKVQVEYQGQTYFAESDQDDDLHEKSGDVKKQSANNNFLGIHIMVDANHSKYTLQINKQCIMDMFQKFYKEALGQ